MQGTQVQQAARTTGCKTNVSILNANTNILYYRCDHQQVLQSIVTKEATHISLMPRIAPNGRSIPERHVKTIYTDYPPFHVSIDMLTSANSQQFDNRFQRVYMVCVVSLDLMLQLRITLTSIRRPSTVPYPSTGIIQSTHGAQLIQNARGGRIDIQGVQQHQVVDVCHIDEVACGQFSVVTEERVRPNSYQISFPRFPILAESSFNADGVPDGGTYVLSYFGTGLRLERFPGSKDGKQFDLGTSIVICPHLCVEMINKVVPQGKNDASQTNFYETVGFDVMVAELLSGRLMSQGGQQIMSSLQGHHTSGNRGNSMPLNHINMQFRSMHNTNNPRDNSRVQQVYGPKSERIFFECYALGQRADRQDILLSTIRAGPNFLNLTCQFTLNKNAQSSIISSQQPSEQTKQGKLQFYYTGDEIVHMQFCRCQNPSLYVQTKRMLYKYTSSSIITYIYQKTLNTKDGKFETKCVGNLLATEIIMLPSGPLQPFFLLNKAKFTYNNTTQTFNQHHQGCQIILYK